MHLNILCFNVHKGMGWGNRKVTLQGIRDQMRTRHPDVIFLQEIRGSQFEFLAEELWPHFCYGKNAVYSKGHHGNAILSKYPIHHSENIDLSFSRYDKRGLLYSQVKLSPHQPTLHFLCVHLGLFKQDRKKQLNRIVEFIDTTVAKDDALILAGDFNDWTNLATIPIVNGLGLQEAFLISHGAYARTFPAWGPLLKLDRLYYRGFDLNHAHRLMDKTWRILSDHIALDVGLTLTV